MVASFFVTVRVAGSTVTFTDGQSRQPILFAGLHAAEHGVDARGQLARVERLGQIVVCADLQAHDAIHVLAAGGQENDGDG